MKRKEIALPEETGRHLIPGFSKYEMAGDGSIYYRSTLKLLTPRVRFGNPIVSLRGDNGRVNTLLVDSIMQLVKDGKTVLPSDAVPIPGEDGYYATPAGEIYSVLRENVRRLQPWVGTKGYLDLQLGGRTVRLHIQIITTFKGPCPPGKEARHLDGVKANCRASNLDWGTHLENSQDRILHGTSGRGAANPRAKLTAEDVIQIRKLLLLGRTHVAVASEFRVSKGAVSSIASRKTWSHLT